MVAYTEIFNNIDQMIEVNEFVRAKNIGFILSQTYGPQGFTFLDYGNDFTINDSDGEETLSYFLGTATQTNPCIITLSDENWRGHEF